MNSPREKVGALLKRISDHVTVELWVGITLLASLFMLIPVFTTKASLGGNFTTPTWINYFISGSIFVSLPMLLELIMDRKLPRTITLPRLLAITALVGPGIIMMLESYKWILYGGTVRELFMRSSLMCNMFQDRLAFTPDRKIKYFAMLIIFTIDLNIRLALVFQDLFVTMTTSPLLFFMTVVYVITMISFFRIVLRMIKEASDASKGGEKYCLYYSLLLVISLFAKALIRALVQFIVEDPIDQAHYMLLVHNILDSTLSILAAVIPSRIARHDHDLAKHLVDTKKSFIRFLSYEYRLSLNTIIASVDEAKLMTNNNPQLDSLQKHLHGTTSACEIACSLLDNVLLFNEMEDRTVSLKVSRCLAIDLVNRALLTMKQKAIHRGVRLNFNVADMRKAIQDIQLDGDEHKLCHVIRNLLAHGINMTPIGEDVDIYCFVKNPREELSPFFQVADNSTDVHPADVEEGWGMRGATEEPQLGFFRFEVHDKGFGLFEEQRDTDVFNDDMVHQYMTGSRESSAEMGLHVSKTIVELHKGNIGRLSVDGKGAVVYIEIPIAGIRVEDEDNVTKGSIKGFTSDSNKACDSGVGSSEDVNDTDDDLGNFLPRDETSDAGRVLSTAMFKDLPSATYDFSIEDVHLNRALIASNREQVVSAVRRTLDNHVAGVVVASTDSQAVSEMREAIDNFNRFSVVYIDRELPGRHSYVVLSRLRKFGYTGVAVLVSGKEFMDTNSRFLSCGGDAILYEPIAMEDLEMTLKDAHHMTMKSDREYMVRRLEQRLKDKQTRERRIQV